VRHHFETVLVPTRETWLAEADGGVVVVVAVLVLDGGELDQLYVDPDWQRGRIGSALVQLAQDRRPGGLALWTFQSNLGARRFYERHGFVAVGGTDGSTNEERAPDVRYVWAGRPTTLDPPRPGSRTSSSPRGSLGNKVSTSWTVGRPGERLRRCR
jgi:hypothetical protein